MKHPLERTDEHGIHYDEPRRHHGVLHQFKTWTIVVSAILTTLLLAAFLWRAGTALFSFTRSVDDLVVSNAQNADALKKITQTASDLTAEVSQLRLHDSLQDAALSADHSQIVGLNRRKADRPAPATGTNP